MAREGEPPSKNGKYDATYQDANGAFPFEAKHENPPRRRWKEGSVALARADLVIIKTNYKGSEGIKRMD
jgi:hypothetical protein